MISNRRECVLLCAVRIGVDFGFAGVIVIFADLGIGIDDALVIFFADFFAGAGILGCFGFVCSDAGCDIFIGNISAACFAHDDIAEFVEIDGGFIVLGRG